MPGKVDGPPCPACGRPLPITHSARLWVKAVSEQEAARVNVAVSEMVYAIGRAWRDRTVEARKRYQAAYYQRRKANR